MATGSGRPGVGGAAASRGQFPRDLASAAPRSASCSGFSGHVGQAPSPSPEVEGPSRSSKGPRVPAIESGPYFPTHPVRSRRKPEFCVANSTRFSGFGRGAGNDNTDECTTTEEMEKKGTALLYSVFLTTVDNTLDGFFQGKLKIFANLRPHPSIPEVACKEGRCWNGPRENQIRPTLQIIECNWEHI